MTRPKGSKNKNKKAKPLVNKENVVLEPLSDVLKDDDEPIEGVQ